MAYGTDLSGAELILLEQVKDADSQHQVRIKIIMLLENYMSRVRVIVLVTT